MDEEPAAAAAQADPAAAAAQADPAAAAAEADPAAKRSAWDDPRVPWAGRPRWVDVACWAGITLSGFYYLALLPFRASLVGKHPLALVLLSGSTEGIISAAAFARVGHGTLVVVLLAAIPGLMKFHPFFWWAGRLWGERIIAMLGGRRSRGTRYMGHVQRWGRKFTWPAVVIANFLPVGSAIMYVIAGWDGMSLVTFLILDMIGTLLWAGMLAGLGYELGHHAVVVAKSISHYGLWVSIGLVVLIVIAQVRSQRRMVRPAARPEGQPEAPAGR